MSYILEAELRTKKGRKTNQLRAEGQVPSIVYGAGVEPMPLTINRNAFLKVYKQAGESMIVELKVNEQNPLHVLIQELQLDPIYDTVTHVDFRSVDMTKEIEADVDLEFVGEAMAVKGLGGTLITSLDFVSVRSLPTKLVRTIQVDLSKLETFDDVIRISDLAMPEGMTVLNDPEDSIAAVEPPRSDAEMAALNSAVEVDITAIGDAEKADKTKEDSSQDNDGKSAVSSG